MLALALASCRSCDAPSPAPGGGASVSGAPEGAPSGVSETVDATRAKRTTTPEIALRNLDAQVAAAERIVEQPGAPWSAKSRFASALLDRGALVGRLSDLERALSVAEDAVAEVGRRKDTLALLAQAHAALHHFPEALAALDEARSLGELPENQRGARAAILDATGHPDEALALRRAEREAYANTATSCAEAASLGATGALEDASRGFRTGIGLQRDVAPFPIAWCLFEEGRMWERAAQPAKARALFEEAVRRVPAFAHAAQHLAALVEPERGLQLLAGVAQRADDPTYAGALAELERRAGKPGWEARAAEAKRRFEALEAKHPAAIGEHAARFWAGVGGDPARGLALARAAFAARRTPDLLETLLAVAETAAAGDLCELAREAEKVPRPHATLRAEAARLLERCGDAAAAARVRAR